MTGLLPSLFALLLVGVVNALVLASVSSMRPPSQGRFVGRVYAATFLLRVALALVLNYFSGDSTFAATFWGDSSTYDSAGYMLARTWWGEVGDTRLTGAPSGWGFVYLVGALYFVFGRNQLLVQLLNCMVGAVTVLVIYAISARLFGQAVGRRAALLMAFFPQIIFWSAGMYKDPLILLCIALCMYAVLRLREELSVTQVALFVLSALALLSLRFYIFYFVVAAALGTFVFGGRGNVLQRLLSYVVLTGVLLGAFTVGVRQETLERQAALMTLQQVQVTREDQAMLGHSAYGGGHDVTSPGGALRALPAGLAYLLFAPFPWAINGVRQALTLPETLVWYGLMPAFVAGLVYSVRHRLRDVLPILVFTVALTLAYALMQGNVGTAYRQRTQISMFFFVFMAVGLQLRHLRRQGVAQPGAFLERDEPPPLPLEESAGADRSFAIAMGPGDQMPARPTTSKAIVPRAAPDRQQTSRQPAALGTVADHDFIAPKEGSVEDRRGTSTGERPSNAVKPKTPPGLPFTRRG